MKLVSLSLLSLFICQSLTADSSNNSTSVATNATTEEVSATYNVDGRSLDDSPREGRIINDDKMTIKGFIPIMGLADDSSKPKPSNEEKYLDSYMKNMAGNPTSDSNNNDQQQALIDLYNNLPQHVAKPEDQRYIGAALQGLLGNSNLLSKFQKPSRKSDCICVPFYMCKNGRVIESSGNDMSAIYQQQQTQQQFYRPEPANRFRPPVADSYLPINERSNDFDDSNQNNTQFNQELIGRMLGAGKSMSDGCGLLRTCCHRDVSSPMASMPLSDMSQLGSIDYSDLSELSQLPPSMQQALQHQMYPSHHNPHSYRPGSFNPTLRPPSRHYPKQYRPPKLLNSPSHHQANVISPPVPMAIRNDHHNIGQYAYDKCGARQSIGINGRVQNLNYHESATEFGEFPWQVAILKRLGPSDNLYVCGGSLISSNFILTAAHCIKKFQPQDLKVRLGEWDVHREDEFYPYVEKHIVDIALHPQFNPLNLAYDVAILKLESDIDFTQSPHISPICLAEPFESFTGHRCYVSGWGKNAFGNQGEYQSVLTKVDLPVLDSRMCESAFKRTKLGFGFRLDRSMICAGGEAGKDSCEGDGGSPLACDVNGTWKVAGLVSWGLSCGTAGVPGVYTNIAHIKPWVDRTIFPYYATMMRSKTTSGEKNFNELINERSFGVNDNSTILNNATSTPAPTTNN